MDDTNNLSLQPVEKPAANDEHYHHADEFANAVFLRIEAIIDNSDAKSESKRAFKKRIGSLLEIYQRRGGDLKTFLEAAKEGRLNEVARLEKGVKKAIKQALEEFRDELEEKK